MPCERHKISGYYSNLGCEYLFAQLDPIALFKIHDSWLTALQGCIWIWHYKAVLEQVFTFNILETSAQFYSSFYWVSFCLNLGLPSETGCV